MSRDCVAHLFRRISNDKLVPRGGFRLNVSSKAELGYESRILRWTRGGHERSLLLGAWFLKREGGEVYLIQFTV